MKIKTVHCFFEQSGTFKREFEKLGVHAEDYDILNEFGETDHIMDLFGEINKAYSGGASVFDSIGTDDLIMAFFPCVRFETQAKLWFQGNNFAQKDWTDKQKLECCITFNAELNELYTLVSKMFIVCINKGIRLIMENPYSTQHYLTNYWCMKPAIVDDDRTLRGDYYKKPTQYWFLNCEPEQNFIFEPLAWNGGFNIVCVGNEQKKVMGAKNAKVARSMIHPDYANRFIREFVLTMEQ